MKDNESRVSISHIDFKLHPTSRQTYFGLLFVRLGSSATWASSTFLDCVKYSPCPITKIDTVAKDVMAEEVDYQDGVIFFCAKGCPIGFHELTIDH